MSNLLLVAKIGAPHGVRGEVKVFSYLEEAKGLVSFSPLTDASGKKYTLKSMKTMGKVLVFTIEGIASRNDAEHLNGIELFMPKNKLPKPAADEFYLDDLIGLNCVSDTGELIGVALSIQNYGASDILEIELVDGSEIMIPFADKFVGDISLEKREIVVFMPEMVEVEGEEEV